MSGVVLRAKIKELLLQRGHAMTSEEIAAALAVRKSAVTAAIHNAPRDTFKRAHGTRGDAKPATLWELGSRGAVPAVTGVWQI